MVNQLLSIPFGGWPQVLLLIPWETKVTLWSPTTSHKTNWWWFAQLMHSDSSFKMPPISWNWLKIRLIHTDSQRWAVSTIFATDTFDLMQLVTGCTFWAFIWRHIMSGKYHCKYPITHRVSENSKSGREKNDALKHKNCTRSCRHLWQTDRNPKDGNVSQWQNK